MKKFALSYGGFVALTFAMLLPAAQANAASVETTTVSARHYVMPKGDHLTHRTGKRDQLHRLGYKISATERDRLRKSSTGSVSNDHALEAETRAVTAPAVGRICTTNSADVFTPSDINGAASSTHLVVVTNDAVGVYRRDGCSTLSRVSLEDFVTANFTIPSTQEVFDPRVIYDPANQRFMITAETFDDLNFDQFQYFAVSTDSTASAWNIYQITLSKGFNVFCKLARRSFWDYPMAGQNKTRWFITANDFPSGQPEEGGGRAADDPKAAILSIDKKPSLSGHDISVSCFKKLVVNLAPPIVLDAETDAHFLSTDGIGTGDKLVEYVLDTTHAHAVDDTLTTFPAVVIPNWTLPPLAPQPNGQTLDTLDGRFQSPSIQDGTSLWNVHAIDVGGYSRWRLYKFNNTPLGSSLAFSITPSTIASGYDDLFNPSVATRSDSSTDPAFVTFTRTIRTATGPRGYASMMVAKGPNASKTGWASVLVSTSLDQYVETGFRAGSTRCNADPDIHTCRWGDYSSTQIDPANTSRAWGFNQLIIGRTSKNWTTKGAQIR